MRLCLMLLLATAIGLSDFLISSGGINESMAAKLDPEVIGEGNGENPTECTAFDDVTDQTDLPCCHIAENNDQLPTYLLNVVRLDKATGTISIFYNTDMFNELGMRHQVLVPLVSPNKYEIEFNLTAEFPDGKGCQKGFYQKKRSSPRHFRNKFGQGFGRRPMDYFNYSSLVTADELFADGGETSQHLSGLVRQTVLSLQPLTISYGLYPDGESRTADDGSRLCRSFIQTSPEMLDNRPPKIKIRIVNHPQRPFYTFTDGVVQVSRQNNQMMCPVELREWQGFGYYLPFRLMKPEVVGFDREAKIQGIALKQFVGEYAHLSCPFTLTFSNQYRLLIPPPKEIPTEAPSTSTESTTTSSTTKDYPWRGKR